MFASLRLVAMSSLGFAAASLTVAYSASEKVSLLQMQHSAAAGESREKYHAWVPPDSNKASHTKKTNAARDRVKAPTSEELLAKVVSSKTVPGASGMADGQLLTGHRRTGHRRTGHLRKAKHHFPSSEIRNYQHGHPYANLKRLKVMGTWDSGTNFMDRLLRINLEAGLPDNGFADHTAGYETRYPPSCERFLPGINPGRHNSSDVMMITPAPLLCGDTWSGSGIHKHNFPSGRWVDLLMREKNTVVVAMVRSPIAHLDALKKAAYNLDKCWFQPHPDAPCLMKAKDEVVWDDEGNCVNRTFAGAADLVQQFINRYAYYRDSAHAKVVMVVYEEAVLQPEKALRKVFKALGLEKYLPSPIIPFDDPAKPHGDALSTAGARDIIFQREYLRNQTLTEFFEASCAQLDRKLMKQFIVPTEPPRTFYSDCQDLQQAK